MRSEQQVTRCYVNNNNNNIDGLVSASRVSSTGTEVVLFDSNETRVKQTYSETTTVRNGEVGRGLRRTHHVDQRPTKRIVRRHRWQSQDDLLRMAEECDDSYVSKPEMCRLSDNDVSSGLRAKAGMYASQPDLCSDISSVSSTSGKTSFCVLGGRKRVSSLRALACCCFRFNMLDIDVIL